jgi:hypothetical protein
MGCYIEQDTFDVIDTFDKQKIFEMYEITYKYKGWYKNVDELFQPRYNWIVYDDTHLFYFLCQHTHNNNNDSTDDNNTKKKKISVVCHNGTPVSKQYMIISLENLINRGDYYIEASGALAWTLIKNDNVGIAIDPCEYLKNKNAYVDEIEMNVEFNKRDKYSHQYIRKHQFTQESQPYATKEIMFVAKNTNK